MPELIIFMSKLSWRNFPLPINSLKVTISCERTKMKFYWIAALAIFMSHAALAAPATKPKAITVGEAPLVIDRGQARRLFVVGFEGQVNIIPTARGSKV